MSIRRTSAVALVVATVSISLLSGCSTITHAVAQTKPVACTQLASALTKVGKGLNSSLSSFASDPASAVTGMEEADTTFKSALKKIQNAEVAKAGQKAEKSLATLIADVKAQTANPSADTSALDKDNTALQTDLTALGKICS